MKFNQPAPELPVRDWMAARAYYVERLGFTPAWTLEDARMAAIAHGDCAIFLRQSEAKIVPVVLWMFAEDVDAAYEALLARGADVQDPPVDEPWGLRQFTVQDRDGHRFHIFHDL